MRLDPDKVPSTVEAAVQGVVDALDENEKTVIRSFADLSSATCHHGTGRFVRNNWSLWEPDSPLKRDAVEKYGIAHADDISGLIFEWAFARVRGEEFDPVAYCERFHEHWRRYGKTSLEAGGWPPGEGSSL